VVIISVFAASVGRGRPIVVIAVRSWAMQNDAEKHRDDTEKQKTAKGSIGKQKQNAVYVLCRKNQRVIMTLRKKNKINRPTTLPSTIGAL
jgi:hypothetical protein